MLYSLVDSRQVCLTDINITLSWKETLSLFQELISEIIVFFGSHCPDEVFVFFRELLDGLEKQFETDIKLSFVDTGEVVRDEVQAENIEKLQPEDVRVVMQEYFTTPEGMAEIVAWREMINSVFSMLSKPNVAESFKLKYMDPEAVEGLPAFLQVLQRMGEVVSPSHKKIDPAKHSLDAVYQYLTDRESLRDGVSPDQQIVEIVGTLFHDLGKVWGPQVVAHSQFSWLVAAPIVDALVEDIQRQQQLIGAAHIWSQDKLNEWIEFLVRFHDICGLVGPEKISLQDVFDLVDRFQIDESLWQALGRVQVADMTATKGILAKWVQENWDTFNKVLAHIRYRQPRYTVFSADKHEQQPTPLALATRWPLPS